MGQAYQYRWSCKDGFGRICSGSLQCCGHLEVKKHSDSDLLYGEDILNWKNDIISISNQSKETEKTTDYTHERKIHINQTLSWAQTRRVRESLIKHILLSFFMEMNHNCSKFQQIINLHMWSTHSSLINYKTVFVFSTFAERTEEKRVLFWCCVLCYIVIQEKWKQLSSTKPHNLLHSAEFAPTTQCWNM